jgi:predicted NAD/FAD-binding protein
MSCAHHLANHPDKFDVTLIDAEDYCGGQAFSIPLEKERHGASWLNQGVQGGSYIFHHTMTMFARQGHHADPVKLQVSTSAKRAEMRLTPGGLVRQRRQLLDECLSNQTPRPASK